MPDIHTTTPKSHCPLCRHPGPLKEVASAVSRTRSLTSFLPVLKLEDLLLGSEPCFSAMVGENFVPAICVHLLFLINLSPKKHFSTPNLYRIHPIYSFRCENNIQKLDRTFNVNQRPLLAGCRRQCASCANLEIWKHLSRIKKSQWKKKTTKWLVT